MAITLLYGCCQIETTTPNLAETREFFINGLGAGPIEQVLAKQIDGIAPGTRYGCDHLGLGEAVFQINQPDPDMIFNGHKSIHQAYLDRVGPSVTNLNFFVDDFAHARGLLAGMGAETFIDGPSSAARALADYGPDNTRPGGDERPFLFLGSRHLIGLDLEIMEPNFLRFIDQTAQYPAYVQPRPRTGDDNLVVERLRIAVADIEQTYTHLLNLFTPGCRSKAYSYRAGPQGRAFHIWLGGIEIEYCQPTSARGALAATLDRDGPGVIAIDFGAADLDAVLAHCEDRVQIQDEPDWLGLEDNSMPRRMICSRAKTGFDTVVGAMGEHPFPTLAA